MLRNKFTKVPCILHWTIHSVDLKQRVKGSFEVQWSRGHVKGQTDQLKSSSTSNELNFETNFEIPCTIYVNKCDQSIRAKIIKIVLNRYTDPTHCKVYGKLTLDAGKYYGVGPVKDSLEMESGRSTAPIFNVTFDMKQIGNSSESAVDENDLSFVGEPQDKMKTNLDEWDITEIGGNDGTSDANDLLEGLGDPGAGEKRKKKKKRKGHHHERPHSQSNLEDEVENKEDENEKKEDENENKEDENEKKEDENEKKEDENEKKEDEVEKKEDENEKKEDENENKEGENEKKEDENENKEDENEKKEDENEKKEDEDEKKEDENEKKEDEDEKKEDEDEKKEDENEKKEDENEKKEDEDEKKEDETKEQQDESKKEEEPQAIQTITTQNSSTSLDSEEETKKDDDSDEDKEGKDPAQEEAKIEQTSQEMEKKELPKDEEEDIKDIESKKENESSDKDGKDEDETKNEEKIENKEEQTLEEIEQTQGPMKEDAKIEETRKEEEEKKEETTKESSSTSDEEEVTEKKDKEQPAIDEKPKVEDEKNESSSSSFSSDGEVDKPKEDEQKEETKELTEERDNEEKVEKKDEPEVKKEDSVEKIENTPVESKEEENSSSSRSDDESRDDEKKAEEQNDEQKQEQKEDKKEETNISDKKEEEKKEEKPAAQEETKNEYSDSESDYSEEEEDDEEDLVETVSRVITRHWHAQNPPAYIDDRRHIYPHMIFPIHAVILYSKMLHTESGNTLDLLRTFITTYSQHNISSKSHPRFYTDLLLCLMIKQDTFLDKGKVGQFLPKLETIFRKSFNSFFDPMMKGFDVVINRFVTGRFEIDPLLSDFKHLFTKIRSAIKFPISVNHLVMKIVTTKLEYKIINKILSSPMRFLFSNVITWNSFISAFLSDERIEMEFLRELIAVMMMVQTISVDPAIFEQISHYLTPKMVCFIMKNYHPDVMMQKPIDYSDFAHHFNIKDIESRMSVPEPPFPDIYETIPGLNLKTWNTGGIDKASLEEFPWLKNFCCSKE